MGDIKEKRYITDNSKLMAEWNWEKNVDISPNQITVGSEKKVWWKCGRGHEWQATINSRNKGAGCPYCAGKKPIKGENDLQTANPTLIKEWNWKKNVRISPNQFTVGSEKKVWWKCSKGHEWQANINARNRGNGCPYCAGRKVIEGENDLQTLNPILMEEWNWEKNVDVNPNQLTIQSGRKVWWKCSKGHEYQARISHKYVGIGCPYCGHKIPIKGENDLQTVNPNLAIEWNYARNKGLTPLDVLPNSNKKVWWKCDKGHEWQATVNSRNSGCSCPYCTNKKVLKGFNDLQTTNPNLAQEWNYERNGNLIPEHFVANSNKKVWWKCSKGHEWQAQISDRNQGRGCPYCAGRKVLVGFNDLQTVNSILVKEWNWEKNIGISPNQFTVGSEKKVWWKCNKGHEWQATITDRHNGTGCPYCANKKVLIGFNDLQTVNPTLVNEWNYEKNGSLAPEHFMANSNKKVWWKCNKGHEWSSTLASRNAGRGCPVCSKERHTSFPEYALVFYLEKYGVKAVHCYRGKGYELDVYIPTKNVAIEYDGFFWHRNKTKQDLEKNLKCKNDGIMLYRLREGLPPLYGSSLDYIVQKNQKDLSAVTKKVLSDIIGVDIDVDLERDAIAIENLREFTEKRNSILVVNPTLAEEWNYGRNGNLKPEHFTVHSSRKVWWKCSQGHEWQATISHRSSGRRCPYCVGKKAIKGKSDLQTVNPTLAKEWNYERNNELTPVDVLPNSNKKVWWKCSKGHEWQARISDRNKGNGCPYCAKEKTE